MKASNKTTARQPSTMRNVHSSSRTRMAVTILCLHLPFSKSFSAQSSVNSYSAHQFPQTSLTQLDAVSIRLPGRNARNAVDQVVNDQAKQQHRWHNMVIKRVFRRDRQQLQATTALLMDEAQRGTNPIYLDYQESLPALASPTQSSSISPLLVINTSTASKTFPKPTPLKPQGKMFSRTTRGVAENTLQNLLLRWSNGNAQNMKVSCEPKSNLLDLARGLFRCDATVDCDAMKFPCLQFSGGRLSTQRLALNLYSFTALNRGHRFPNQFDFEATDILFTAEDLFASNCIRNGLARLLTRILKNRGIEASKVRMQSIGFSPDGKLSCRGRVKTDLTDVSFQVRTGLATASLGHVLAFPGLEISLSPALGLFFPVPEVSLDLGYSGKIRELRLDPATGLHISAQATVTPRHTLTLMQSYAQSTKSYAAPFSVDVGRFVTRIGNFNS
mmetsp:Transcript_10417/g.19985  ORF Transcript_10417/g.19985 Transcript_10417/m.19985 type:complete len:444 (-) Transcript_10417:156-1487(-)|eukprot:scaffold2155_cov162-Amphora_coffeaeformis.AAC.6